MRQDWFIAAVLSVSMLAVAQQQPKVINAQFHTESAGAGLSATVAPLQHSNGPLWLGYEVAAVPGSHFSMCSDDTDSSGRWMLRCVSTGGFEQHFPIVEPRSGDRDQHCRPGADRSRGGGQGSLHWDRVPAGCGRIAVHLVNGCQGGRQRGVVVEPGNGGQQAPHGPGTGRNRDA